MIGNMLMSQPYSRKEREEKAKQLQASEFNMYWM